MRDSVRWLCSLLIASNPRPIPKTGTRIVSRSRRFIGIPSRCAVNRRRNKNGSSAVTSLIWSIARYTATTANTTTNIWSTSMRTLARWSRSSFNSTTLRPCRADPSRRIAGSFMALEVFGIDHLQARLLDGEPQQASAGADHRGGCLRPHVVLGREPQAIWAELLDLLHAGDGRELLG